MKQKTYYISIHYWQGGEEDTYTFDKLIKEGKYSECLNEAKEIAYFFDGELCTEEVSLSPYNYNGDDVVCEDKKYALIRNNYIGGTYDLRIKLTEEEFKKENERLNGQLLKNLRK